MKQQARTDAIEALDLKQFAKDLYGDYLEFSKEPLSFMDSFKFSQVIYASDLEAFLERLQFNSFDNLTEIEFPKTIVLDSITFHFYRFKDVYLNANMIDNVINLLPNPHFYHIKKEFPILISNENYAYIIAPMKEEMLMLRGLIEIDQAEYKHLSNFTVKKLTEMVSTQGIDISDPKFKRKDHLIYAIKKPKEEPAASIMRKIKKEPIKIELSEEDKLKVGYKYGIKTFTQYRKEHEWETLEESELTVKGMCKQQFELDSEGKERIARCKLGVDDAIEEYKVFRAKHPLKRKPKFIDRSPLKKYKDTKKGRKTHA
jgi:hypothetical protein